MLVLLSLLPGLMYFSGLIISWKNADRVYDSDKAKQMSLFGEGEGSNFFQGSKPK